MEFKGTKKEWKVSSIELKDYESHIVASGDDIICNLYNNGNQKSNAKLIASAPDLLEALQYLVKENMLSHAGDEIAQKAIEKALL